MPLNFSDSLADVVQSLSRCISALDAVGMRETASLLRMSRMDLQMRLNAISEEELALLCEKIEREALLPRSYAMPAQ
jgi:hypothetical protein